MVNLIRYVLSIVVAAWLLTSLLQSGIAIVRAESFQAEQQHSKIEREIATAEGRLTNLEEYTGALKQAKIRERLVLIESSLQTIMNMLYALLLGVGSLFAKDLYEVLKLARRSLPPQER